MEINGRLINQQPAYDGLDNSEVLLQHGNDPQSEKLIQRSIGLYGIVAGKYLDNPILNSMVYDVDLPDGTAREYVVNVIEEKCLPI